MPLFGGTDVEKLKRKQDVKRLAKALTHADEEIREQAADALGELADPSAATPLASVALDDEEWAVRYSAATSLSQLDDAGAVQVLIDALGAGETTRRERAAEALGRAPHQSAADALIKALDDDHMVARGAASALGELRDARAVEPLMRALADSDYDKRGLRRAAAQALGELGDTRAVPALIAMLDDEYSEAASAAAAALAKLGDERAVEPLIRGLKSEAALTSWNTVPAAARALGELGSPAAVEPLSACLRSEYPRIRDAAVEALRQIGGPEAEAALGSARD